MKVLHYHFGKEGGAEAFFCHLVRGLADSGVEQKVVIRPGRSWRDKVAGSAEILAESNFRNLSLDRWTVPRRIQRVIRDWRPDAVLAWMARAGHLLPVDAGGALRLGRLGDYPDRLTQFERADKLICNAPGIIDRVRDLGWTKPVELVTNFTSTERVDPIDRAELDTPAGAPVVCSVGRLVPRKGFHWLIEAIAHVPEAFLWIVGDGPERTALEELAERIGVAPRVRFTGWRNDARPCLAASDVCVLPSRLEPLGNVILEGWSQGKPVVASNSGGPLWLIREGQNGLLFETGEPEDCARAIRQVLDDRGLATHLAAGGQASLQGGFSEEAVIATYKRVLSGAEPQAAAA
ncbi:Alpha-D-kanosaminyltransferase [Pseudobythopirellula maris]|uniref:Alpha-D-kanosaminyltransferase n=1 Tax=Pseudobythopirellula maris TaxID=2527991 RepID=A0A5C5ZIH0_9BACT|nr:glycosyltransferase [Pseudobythopirellula maris]TWT86601.1 Alpha-D-kanosaminyltransferase [Pseudobythopirellula maris]